MSFPPTPTNLWDITQPPDTQLANLLGQDIRNLKNDIMQRLSLLSGGLANRPTPETVNATWGGVAYGLLYFSTDSGQIFQWNGSAWIDVTTSIGSGIKDYDDFTSVSFAGVAPAGIRNLIIPAGAVQNGAISASFLEIESSFRITGFTGAAPNYTLNIAGSNVLSVTSPLYNGVDIFCKTSMVFSSLLNPRVISMMRANTDTVTPVVTITTLPGPVTGASSFQIAEAFGNSTTITATAHYMHVRVRR